MALPTMAFLLALLVATAFQSAHSKPFPAPDLRLCSMALNDTSENCCTLPATNLGPQKKFSFQPQLPLRVRPAAHLVSDAYITKYQRAVERMRALPETDGRSFVAQYRLHCAYCNNHLYYKGNEYPLEIHQGWLFFTWHRLYLYFHERILAKLINDDEFALPYWNWDNQNTTEPLPNVIPRVWALNVSLYADAINKTSSLFHPQRNPCSTTPGRIVEFQTVLGACTPQNLDEVRKQNGRLLWTQLESAGVTPLTMHGQPYRYGDYGAVGMGAMESRPHGPVHIWTNVINMATNKDSASDPIFFGHHANVDRLWEQWKGKGKYRKDITDPDYLNTEFTFYDEDGEQVTVSVKQSLDLGLLRYKYQELPTPWTNQPAIDTNWTFCNPASSPSDIAALTAATPRFKAPLYTKSGPTTFKIKRRPNMSARHGEEMLELKARFNWHEEHLQNIFLFLPNSTYDFTSIGCKEFLGNLFSFPHVGQSPELKPEMTFRIGIRKKLELMQRANLEELVVTMVGEIPQGLIPGEAGFELTGARIVYSKI